jgi:hypothetical protein
VQPDVGALAANLFKRDELSRPPLLYPYWHQARNASERLSCGPVATRAVPRERSSCRRPRAGRLDRAVNVPAAAAEEEHHGRWLAMPYLVSTLSLPSSLTASFLIVFSASLIDVDGFCAILPVASLIARP